MSHSRVRARVRAVPDASRAQQHPAHGAPRRIGVVGAGRVGAVVAAALRRAGHEIVGVSGDSPTSRGRAERLLPGVPLLPPAAVAEAAEVVVLAVPDDALGGLVEVLVAGGSLREHQYVVHTSGRHGLGVLGPAGEIGARPVALHPAMTFSGSEVDRLEGCVVGVTAGPGERRFALELVADLGARPTEVAEQHRTLYHAGLAHGANHMVTLVAQARELLAAAGVADPSAVLRPLLSAALDGALANGDAALTGPVVRGDAGTVAGHRAELAAHAPQALAAYDALARATLARVETDGRLDDVRARGVAHALEQCGRLEARS